jgi:hypothetical protein
VLAQSFWEIEASSAEACKITGVDVLLGIAKHPTYVFLNRPAMLAIEHAPLGRKTLDSFMSIRVQSVQLKT